MQTATIIGIQYTKTINTSTLAAIGNYTVPASTGAVITHLYVANIGSVAGFANVTLYNGSVDVYLADAAPIAVDDTLDVLNGNRIVLQAGWSIRVAAVSGTFDASMSVTQFS